MFFDKPIETASRETIEALQLARLKDCVNRVYEHVPLYRKRFDEAKIKPEDIRTLDDLKLIPFTYKQDLRDTYPFGMFAVPREQVVRVHASSGTTGKPTEYGPICRVWSMRWIVALCGAQSTADRRTLQV